MITLRKRGTGSNLVDMGRDAVHDRHVVVVDSEVGLACRWGGHGEDLRRSHGDAAGAKLGAKLVDRFFVNTGTVLESFPLVGSHRVSGIGPSSAEGQGQGGGPVVVRAGERPVHGEGGQQVGSLWAGMPGGRW